MNEATVKRYDLYKNEEAVLRTEFVLASDYDALFAILAQQVADEAEQDAAIRDSVRRILGAYVDGDGYSAPPLCEVVETMATSYDAMVERHGNVEPLQRRLRELEEVAREATQQLQPLASATTPRASR